MNSFRIISPRELTAADTVQWRRMAAAPRYLNSPFFRPEFTQAVAEVRDDVEIALLESSGELVGVFPFQRASGGLARNVCSRLSEFHAPVTCDGIEWDTVAMLRVAQLTWWQFDHLPIGTAPGTGHVWGQNTSPFMDLSGGYDAYVAERRAAGSSSVSQTLRKARKIEREQGPLRFDYHTDSEHAFEALIRWKDAQHQRTGRLRVLQYDWLLRLLRNLTSTDRQNTLGLFSALYAGEQLIAVHLGLRTERVVHLWFPAYDPAFERYSPGLILLLNILQEAASRGVQRVDLGKGRERYKGSFKSGDILIGEGAVDLRPVRGPLRRRWYDAKRTLRNSRFQRQFEWPMELTRSLRQRLAFE